MSRVRGNCCASTVQMYSGSMKSAVVLALGLTIAVSWAGAATSANVRGIVTRGPIAPVCREGVPCNEPVAGVRLAFERAGRRVALERTDANGRFALHLAPGRYVVRLARKPAIGGFAPVTFTVRAGHVVRLRLAIDTGIR